RRVLDPGQLTHFRDWRFKASPMVVMPLWSPTRDGSCLPHHRETTVQFRHSESIRSWFDSSRRPHENRSCCRRYLLADVQAPHHPILAEPQRHVATVLWLLQVPSWLCHVHFRSGGAL